MCVCVYTRGGSVMSARRLQNQLHSHANSNWAHGTNQQNLTFSYCVWSVHLASSDRDGVLGQCVRQRPVVALPLHRNKISSANKK